jgi:replicative DNA helicase Mcm
MTNKQFQILEWVYENQDNFPLKSGKIFQAYQETENYEGRQNSFSELLSKLYNKGLLNKPNYGEYNISDRGIQRVEKFKGLNVDKYRRPDNYKDVVDELKAFLLEEKDEEMHEAAGRGDTWNVSLDEIDRFNVDVVSEFMRENVDDFFDAFDEALEFCLESSEEIDYRFKPDLNYLQKDIHEAKSGGIIGKPVIVEGMIKTSKDICPKVLSAVFECTQCGDQYKKEQESSQLNSPYKCECGSKRFEPIEKKMVDVIDFELTQRSDTQVKVPCELEPAKISDTENIMSGQRVKVLAVPKEVPKSKNSRKFDVMLKVKSYQRIDKKTDIKEFSRDKKNQVIEDFKEFDEPFEAFAESIAPNVADMKLAKKCVAASLIGAPEDDKGINKDYGRIHVGIVTNPGMGKSNLQSWVRETFSNVHRATGGTGTGTALTGTAEQTEGNQWRVVAGKVVFADKGFLQVDEFDKFREGELTKLNTAMEDGYFPVDKASVSAELPGRASIIATGNFVNKLDEFSDPMEELPEKGQGLYDRFALMCAITKQGEEVADKILGIGADKFEHVDEPFSPEELRIYRHIAREFKPELSKDAKLHLKDYFQASKNKEDTDSNSGAEIKGKSNRLLVNLKKLALCIARANLRDIATLKDAEKATKLMRETRQSLGLDLGESPGSKFKKTHRLQDCR